MLPRSGFIIERNYLFHVFLVFIGFGLFVPLSPIADDDIFLDCPIVSGSLFGDNGAYGKANEISFLFSQKRKISGFKKSIESEGVFRLRPEEEIVWETLRPFHSIVRVSSKGFELVRKDGSGSGEKIENHNSPFLMRLSNLLLDLHSLSMARSNEERNEIKKRLNSSLKLECIKDTGSGLSTLLAIPDDYRIKKAISSIRLKGNDYPASITIEDSRGDITEIELREIDVKR
ncbi:MAG TPA: hypothetical protein PKA63_14430 [Oligoflexia bacterium]|nr:hypothetical protein [Oligoflexia bacterium]HMP49862.1 hypothetical protein [Oligoflexia bacterium]